MNLLVSTIDDQYHTDIPYLRGKDDTFSLKIADLNWSYSLSLGALKSEKHLDSPQRLEGTGSERKPVSDNHGPGID